ncbi:hypothetical protein [Enhygromyxa salina]|uniref:Uncharacterized protein n=1 Tax=Enhygromyxa salina TaxID=215803 RepID=A0A2S9YX13_9BACT|nr:hypothetical protein [Enhygromyxa salina]PRQ09636.1 hypothetical protein ENSA7_06980 [Enhygromyxa salina]
MLRIAESFEVAEKIDLDDWLALTGRERLEIGEQMRREAWPYLANYAEHGLRASRSHQHPQIA